MNRHPQKNVLSQQRSTSLPINEFNRALRSHSVVTEEFPQPEKNEESVETNGYTRPRRATTPSRLWEPSRTPGFVVDLGLSPRPASSQARGSHLPREEDSGSPIGVAVTSGSHPNRRSRSVGELRGAMAGKSVSRRRSDEIRYWRDSYDPGVLSPMSSNKADEADEPIILDEPEQNREAQPQPQPFNFGPMGEMAGMKITQAATLESRVQRLEKRLYEVERVVVFTRKQHRASGDPLILQDPPRRSSKSRSTSRTRPRTDNSEPSLPGQERYRGVQQMPPSQARQIRSSSYGSSRPSTTSTHNSYHPSFDNTTFLTSPSQADFNASTQTARPLSTSTTIRAPGSSPTTASKSNSLTGEHYTALTNMILAEQASRQHLETMVRTLQLQVQKLRAREAEFSSFEQDEEDDFRTPSEEKLFGEEQIFGTEQPAEVKTAPRTLSLSQMTLGRGVQPGMNF